MIFWLPFVVDWGEEKRKRGGKKVDNKHPHIDAWRSLFRRGGEGKDILIELPEENS